jgi:hypothetical protein
VGSCWELSRKNTAADLPPDFFDRFCAVPIRLQQLPCGTVEDFALPDDVIGRFRGNGRYRQTWPALLDQDAGEVVDVQSLHGCNDQAVLWVVETAESRVAEPVAGCLESNLGVGIIGLDRIIDNQSIAAAAGQRAAHGGCETISSLRRLELALAIPRVRKSFVESSASSATWSC